MENPECRIRLDAVRFRTVSGPGGGNPEMPLTVMYGYFLKIGMTHPEAIEAAMTEYAQACASLQGLIMKTIAEFACYLIRSVHRNNENSGGDYC